MLDTTPEINVELNTFEDFFSPLTESLVKKYIITRNSSDDENKSAIDNVIERWVVVGTERIYYVGDDFCTCYSFILDNLKKINICKHIKLCNEAKVSKRYNSFFISFSEYEFFRNEWLKEK
ncbi:MAG: hypothetical protein HeimC3_17720 [Candidatus Heimdallarchaeota archaeon LC_3]|nr:MAG: hypothetical protein HeimC3_17720 [Candidatus Heimdallarchaeota archaeon LC_3]